MSTKNITEQTILALVKSQDEKLTSLIKFQEEKKESDIKIEKILDDLKAALIGTIENPGGFATEIKDLRKEISIGFSSLESKMAKNEDLKELKGKVDVMGDVSKIKSDIIKWLAYGFGAIVTLGVGLGIWKHFAP